MKTTVDRGCYESSFGDSCPADLDDDGQVASSDLLLFLAAYGSDCVGEDCPEDFTGDATFNVSDLLVFLAAYGAPCQ